MPGMDEGVFLDDRGDVGHPGTLGQWHELHRDGDLVPRRVGLVGQGETIHDLARPSVFDLQRLVVLQRLVGEPTEDVDVLGRVEIVLKRRPVRGRLEFVSNIGVVQVGPDARGQVARKGEIERKDVLTGLHRVVVRFLTGEETPLVRDDRVVVMVVLCRRSDNVERANERASGRSCVDRGGAQVSHAPHVVVVVPSRHSRASLVKDDLALAFQPHTDLPDVRTLLQIEHHPPAQQGRVVIRSRSTEEDLIVVQLDIKHWQRGMMIPVSVRMGLVIMAMTVTVAV